MSTAVAGRGAANAALEKERMRYAIIGRILESTAIIFAVLVAVELTFGFMACYYSCSARRAGAKENIYPDVEDLPDIPSIVDADQLLKIEYIVNDIPTKVPAYAYFSEKSCITKMNEQDPMHEKMAFGSNLMTPCEMLEEVKSHNLGSAFVGGKKNVTIFEEFLTFLGRLHAKYEQFKGEKEVPNEDCTMVEEAGIDFDNIELVATS